MSTTSTLTYHLNYEQWRSCPIPGRSTGRSIAMPTTLTFIYADRKSFCEVILEKNPCVSPVQLLLNIIYTKFTIKAAKETTIPPSAVLPPVALSSSLLDINYVIKDSPITHDRTREVYAKYHPSIDTARTDNQQDEALAAQLRSVHDLSL